MISQHIGLIFAAYALGLVVAKPARTISDFDDKVKSLTQILYPAAAALLLHVVSQGVWQLRTAALLTNSTDAELVRQMAATIVVNTAVLYVCILFVFHVPALDAVMDQLKLALTKVGICGQDQEKWLVDHRLKDTWQVYADTFAILSPLVASLPLAKLFVAVFS